MSPVSTSPAPLGLLLSDSWSFCKTYWKPILIAAAVFGTIAAVLSASVAGTAAFKAGNMMNEMGVDVQRMQDLMQQGDDASMQEIERMMQNRFGDISESQAMNMGLQFFRAMAPMIGLSMLLAIILWVISTVYFLLLALYPTQDATAPAKKVLPLFFPLLGVMVWSFLRSFAWIPVIGIIPGIILGPRFFLSGVILVQEKKGVTESVRESYSRTAGYWGKIVGNMIVAALCVALATIVINIAAAIIGSVLPIVGLWLVPVGKYATMGFMGAFAVKLSLAIMGKKATPSIATPVVKSVAPIAAVTKRKAPAKKRTAKKSTKKA